MIIEHHLLLNFYQLFPSQVEKQIPSLVIKIQYISKKKKISHSRLKMEMDRLYKKISRGWHGGILSPLQRVGLPHTPPTPTSFPRTLYYTQAFPEHYTIHIAICLLF